MMYLELSIEEVIDELTHFGTISSEDIGGGLVLGHLVGELDDTSSGDLFFLHAKEFQDSAVILIVGVDAHKENLETISDKLRSWHLI
jgi:hypothetical protein